MMKETALSSEYSGSHEVFVSYSRKDLEKVMPYIERLRSADICVWMDKQGIDGSDLWSAKIVEAIKSAKVFMVFCSENSMHSTNVAREVFLSSEEACGFLPVYLEPVDVPSAIRYHFAGIQHVEAFKHDFEKTAAEIERVVARMKLCPDSSQGKFMRNPSKTGVAGFTGVLRHWFCKIPTELRFSLFFSIMGIPGWFLLSIAASFGSAADVRTILSLGFLFVLGLLFNVCGLLTAILGLKQAREFEAFLIVSLLLNAGEAVGATVVLKLGAKGLLGH